ncbi:MAG: tetratricopeptide repeat-containing sensor histidine kinase, partial [Bacteroidetes bacterium]|nr:tetratricopeptide repeat-containing sensor histidine kinase [Bacteroidota bacterium]
IYISAKASAMANQGIELSGQGKRVEAIKLLYQALALIQQTQDSAEIAQTLINIGVNHFNLNDWEEAITLWQEAIGYLDSKADSAKLSQLYSFMAIGTDRLHQDSITEMYLEKSYNYSIGLEDSTARYYALSSLGDFYFNKNEYAKALEYFPRAAALLRGKNQDEELNQVLNSLFKATSQLNRWEEAEDYALEAQAILLPNASLATKESVFSMIYLLQKHKGNYAEALEAAEMYYFYRDSLNKDENINAVYAENYARQALADSLNSAAAISLEKEVSKRRQTFSYFLLVAVAVTLFFIFLIYRQKQIIQRDKEKLDQANAKLKELDDSKSRFFTNISHEFRTPLTVIGGMIDQIMEQPDKWLEKGGMIARRNVDNLLNLTNQILDLRKLEFGSLHLNLVQDHVISFLRYGTQSFESLAASRSVELVFESDLSEQMMDFDPEKLLQIQTNLISNAIKFTPKEGIVKVSVSTVSDNQLQIQVKDTGRGIPSEKLPMIFDRFYQVDQTDTREGEGTGIGLALTKELVELMEGKITVESEVGEGSVFTVLLPIRQNAAIKSVSSSALKKVNHISPPAFQEISDSVISSKADGE